MTELPQVCTFGEPHFISFAFLHKVRKVGLAKPACSERAVHTQYYQGPSFDASILYLEKIDRFEIRSWRKRVIGAIFSDVFEVYH